MTFRLKFVFCASLSSSLKTDVIVHGLWPPWGIGGAEGRARMRFLALLLNSPQSTCSDPLGPYRNPLGLGQRLL